MKHKLYVTGDVDTPVAIKDRNGDVALSLCRVCGQGEGELDSECPGPYRVKTGSSGAALSVVGPALEWLPGNATRTELASLLNSAYVRGWRDGQAAHVAALAGPQTFTTALPASIPSQSAGVRIAELSTQLAQERQRSMALQRECEQWDEKHAAVQRSHGELRREMQREIDDLRSDIVKRDAAESCDNLERRKLIASMATQLACQVYHLTYGNRETGASASVDNWTVAKDSVELAELIAKESGL